MKLHQTKVTINRDTVVINMRKGDYNLLRVTLENAQLTSSDPDIRMGIANLILPYLPAC